MGTYRLPAIVKSGPGDFLSSFLSTPNFLGLLYTHLSIGVRKGDAYNDNRAFPRLHFLISSYLLECLLASYILNVYY